MTARLSPPPHIRQQAGRIFEKEGGQAAWEYYVSQGFPYRNKEAVTRALNRDGYNSAAALGFWTSEENLFLQEHYPDPFVPHRVFVERLKRNWKVISNHASQSLGLRRGVTPSPLPRASALVPRFDFGHAPVLVLADVHVPYQDAAWLDRVIALARAWSVKRTILAGDFYDFHELSNFEVRSGHTLDQELAAGADVLRDLLGSMEHIDYFLGNHEARAGKVMKWKYSLRDLVQNECIPYELRPHVTVHDSYRAYVNADRDGPHWMLEHPKYHGKEVASKLAVRWNVNVAVAHLHHSSITHEPSGRHYGVRIGASCDHDLMPYTCLITHDMGEAMTQGALILKRGENGRTRPYLLEPEMDLEAMQRMYGARKRVHIAVQPDQAAA